MRNINQFTIIGFGNQARAWALNLRDSGIEVHIGLRKNSDSIARAKELHFNVFNFEQSRIPTSFFALLIPDDQHKNALKCISDITQRDSIHCIYAHGYSVFKFKLNSFFPKIQHILLAPKSIASELRFLYETKGNLTGFYSLEYSHGQIEELLPQLKEIASALGLTNLYPTKFQEETQADLFSEQSILCSLLPYGILETYNTLVNKGYSKEIAFYECFYESKLILDTIFKVGPADFFQLISPNALIGSQIGKDLLIDDEFRCKLKLLLSNIESNEFQNKIDNTNVEQLRKNIYNSWKNEELNLTYLELKDSL